MTNKQNLIHHLYGIIHQRAWMNQKHAKDDESLERDVMIRTNSTVYNTKWRKALRRTALRKPHVTMHEYAARITKYICGNEYRTSVS
jgi:hypothetical protein